jgi:hypothetical protein
MDLAIGIGANGGTCAGLAVLLTRIPRNRRFSEFVNERSF